jgi:hypothetical protein
MAAMLRELEALILELTLAKGGVAPQPLRHRPQKRPHRTRRGLRVRTPPFFLTGAASSCSERSSRSNLSPALCLRSTSDPPPSDSQRSMACHCHRVVFDPRRQRRGPHAHGGDIFD